MKRHPPRAPYRPPLFSHDPQVRHRAVGRAKRQGAGAPRAPYQLLDPVKGAKGAPARPTQQQLRRADYRSDTFRQQRQDYRSGLPVWTRDGKYVQVRPAGGGAPHTMTPQKYLQNYGTRSRDLLYREQEARRQGYRSAGAQSLATRAEPRKAPDFAPSYLKRFEDSTLGRALRQQKDLYTPPPAELVRLADKSLRNVRLPSQRGSASKVAGVTVVSTVPPHGHPGLVKAGQTFGGRAVSDALNIGAQAVPSIYQLSAATFEAAHGDYKRAETLWSDYKKTGVLPAAAQGKLGEALKRLGQHPLAGGLELAGGKAVLTRSVPRTALRTAQAVARHSGHPRAAEGLQNVLSTRRGDHVPGLGFVEKRKGGSFPTHPAEGQGRVSRFMQGARATRPISAPAPYSKDLLTKYAPRVGQVARDKRTRAANVKAGRGDTILTKRDFELLKQEGVDHTEGVSAILQREGRHAIEKMVKLYPERFKAAGRLILEGRVRPQHFLADLQLLRDRHAAQLPTLMGQKAATNAANIQELDALIADTNLHRKVAKVASNMRQYAAGLNETEQRLVAVGDLAPERLKAKHVPWLVEHAGARAGTRADAVLSPVGAGRRAARDEVKRTVVAAGGARRQLRVAERQQARISGEAQAMVRAAQRADPRVKAAAHAVRSAKAGAESVAPRVAGPDKAAILRRADDLESEAGLHITNPNVAVRMRRQAAELRKNADALSSGRHTPAQSVAEAQANLRAELDRVKNEVLAPKVRPVQRGPGRLEGGKLEGPKTRNPERVGVGARLDKAGQAVQTARRQTGQAHGQLRAAKQAERSFRAETRGRPATRIPWMVDAAGKEITEARIPEIAKEVGVDPEAIGYVSQRHNLSSAGAHYQYGGLERRPMTPNVRRTGEGVRQGVVDISRDTTIEDAFRSHSKLQGIEANIRMLNEVGAIGLKMDDNGIGGFRTARDGQKGIDELKWQTTRDAQGNATGAVERPQVPDLEVISLAPFLAKRRDIMERLKTADLVDMDTFAASLMDDFETARQTGASMAGKPDHIQAASGPYIIVPKVALDRARQHARNLGPGDLGKAFQAYSHQFRQTVLLTSSKWFAGNTLEMMLRLSVEGATPVDWHHGRRLQKTLEGKDPRRAEEFRVATTGGSHFSTINRYEIRRPSEGYSEHGPFRPMSAAIHEVLNNKASPATPLVKVWRVWKAMIQGANKWVERQGQYTALGIAAKKEWLELRSGMDRSFLMGEKAFEDLSNGLLHTHNHIRYAREVDTIIGKYDRFSPAIRYAMTTYAPFVAWYLNALRFVFATLPSRHPIKTSILASTYAAESDKYRKQGLDLTERGLKGFLQGAPTIGGKTYRLSHYFPFGAVAELDTVAQMALPQFNWMKGLSGVAFNGEKLQYPNGTTPSGEELIGLALYSQAESMISFLRLAKTVQESGGSGYNTNTVWNVNVKDRPAGHLLEGAEKYFNPFYPVAGKTSGGSSEVDKILQRHGLNQTKLPSAQDILKKHGLAK